MSELWLDHVGVAVSELEDGRAAYERLGFTLTTRSEHEGRATGNYCAMFREGYLELLGIAKPGIESSFYDMVGRYQGVHIVAFGCQSAAEMLPVLQARHPGIEPPQLLERDADFGPEANETRRAAFSNIYVDEKIFPEARYIFIEHLTPDVIWQPHLLEHPNGAVAMAEVAICVPDVQAAATRMSAVLGVPADSKAPDIVSLQLPRGQAYLLGPDAVGKWAKGVAPPAVPSVVGFGVKVADLDATRAYLDGAGVSYHDYPYPAIWVEPADGRGAVVSFIQA